MRYVAASLLGSCLAIAGPAHAGEWGGETKLLTKVGILGGTPLPLVLKDEKELVYSDDGAAIYSLRGRIGRRFGSRVELSVPPLQAGEDTLDYPEVDRNSGGDAIVTWQEEQGFSGRVWTSVRRRGRSYGPAQNVGGSPNSHVALVPDEYDVSLSEDGHGLLVYSQYGRRRGFFFRNLSPTKRIFGRSRVLHSKQPLDPPLARVGPGGSAAVAWIERQGLGSRLFVASRPTAAGPWRVQRLSGPREVDVGVSLSMNARGQWAIAWSRNGPRSGTFAAMGSTRRGVGPVRRVGPLLTQFPTEYDETERPALAVDRRGSAVVAFRTGRLLRGRMQAAVRQPGDRRFALATSLSAPGRSKEPLLKLSTTGHAVVTWRGLVATKTPTGGFLRARRVPVGARSRPIRASELHLDAGGTVSAAGTRGGRVRVVSWPTSGRAGRPKDLGPGCSPRLAGSDSGWAVLLWVDSCRGLGGNDDPAVAPVRAAVSRPGGAFGPPTLLGTAQGGEIDLAVGSKGDAFATWRRRTDRFSTDEALYGADYRTR